MAAQFDIACRTDPGLSGKINCDRCAVADREALEDRADAFLMVLDGMGANQRGDTASLVASETVPASLADLLRDAPAPDRDRLAAALREAVAAANLAVWRRAQDDTALRGMGTTCVAAVVADGVALLCHAGDSRGYLLSDGSLTQVTADHSLIQEVVPSDEASVGMESRFGTVVSRGLGLSRSIETDLEVVPFGPRDALLLCTDGLSNLVRERRIVETLAGAATADEACERLIAAANDAGGYDNICVAVVRGAGFEPHVPEQPDTETDLPGAESRPGRSRRRRSRYGWSAPVSVALGALCLVLAALLYAAAADRARLIQALDACRSEAASDVTAGRK